MQFRPSFDKYGNLITEDTVEDLKKEIGRAQNKNVLDKLKSKFNIKGSLTALADTIEVEDRETEEDREIKEEIKRLSKAGKEIFSNKLIQLYADILSDPEQYRSLITPNSTDLIKPISLDIAKDLGKISAAEVDAGGKKPYSGTLIYRYKNDLRKRESLLSAKRLLPIFAVNNTFSQLIQQANINIGSIYKTLSVFQEVSRPTRLLLLNKKEREDVLVDGQINLSNKLAVNGVAKQEYFSQLINGTVDAASDDFLGYINLSYENAGVIAYLTNLGVPLDRTLRFINQPVMLKYYSDLRRSKDYKNVVQGKILSELTGISMFGFNERTQKQEFNPSVFNDTITQLLSYKVAPEGFSFTDEELKSNITNKFGKFLAVPENKRRQAVMFAYFISLQEQSGLFRNFQQVLNFDTTKLQNGLSPKVLKKKKEEIIKNRLFSEDAINQIAKNSIISSFIGNSTVVEQISHQIMPYAYNYTFTEAAAKFIAERPYLNKFKAAKLMRTMENDWIEYLIKGFGTVNNVNIGSLQTVMLEGKETLARQLISMRKKYPELLDTNTFFNRLRQSISTKSTIKQQNVQLQRLFENTSDDQNRYTEEFRQLINFEDSRYTDEQRFEIKKFFTDLAVLGFVQSGFNKSSISFQDIIPYEVLANIFKIGLDRFKTEIAPYKDISNRVVEDFVNKFKLNNPTLISSKRASNQSWRGKKYDLNLATANNIVNLKTKIKLLNQVQKMKQEGLAASIPEIDEQGHVIIENKFIDKIKNKSLRAISFATKQPNGEYTIKDSDGTNQMLVKLTLIDQFRNNIDEYAFERLDNRGSVKQGQDGEPMRYDTEEFAKKNGYASYDEMTNDYRMLPFVAGTQNRFFYQVDLLIAAPKKAKSSKAPKENLNDEPVEPKAKSTKTLKSEDAKKLYKELGGIASPADARGLALEYFVGGGKISPETLYNEVLTKRDERLVPGKKDLQSEIKARDYVEKYAKNIKQIAHSIWDNLSEDVQAKVSEQEVRDEMINIVREFNKRMEMAKEYQVKYGDTLGEYGPQDLPKIEDKNQNNC